MYEVLIFGAGSIGNHLCFACRKKKWRVSIYDHDLDALKRTREDIYPGRYGKWDSDVCLLEQLDISNKYDLVVVGTPPDTHLDIAIDVLNNFRPAVLLIEKPLCTPDLSQCEELFNLATTYETRILVGYNHTLVSVTEMATKLIDQGFVGTPLSIHCRWLEHWGGIFSAHPWLNGPSDSYLGYSERGGGACSEHSHGINMWQFFADYLGAGRIAEVNARLDIVDDGQLRYDRTAQISLVTEGGLVGSVIQDVVSDPPEKMLRIQGECGYLECHINFEENCDALIYGTNQEDRTLQRIEKTRPDDFVGEIDHVEMLLTGELVDSPIDYLITIDTMLVIASAHKSHDERRTISLPIQTTNQRGWSDIA